jgi:hypothetical protein
MNKAKVRSEKYLKCLLFRPGKIICKREMFHRCNECRVGVPQKKLLFLSKTKSKMMRNKCK